MTRFIKFISPVAAVLLLLGTYFKLSHWPGADVMLIAGAAAGILLFMLIVVSVTSKLASGFEKFNLVIASLTLIITLCAFTFKLLHWPGAAKLIWAADIGIILSGVLLLVDGMIEKKPARWSIKIIAAFFIFVLLLVIMLAK